MRLAIDPEPVMLIPLPPLPEMTFRAPIAVPPIVLFGALFDGNSIIPVRDGSAAISIHADLVALQEIVRRGQDANAISVVARDQVALPGDRPADGVIVTVRKTDAAIKVGQGVCACRIRTDEISLDQVVGGSLSREHDPGSAVDTHAVARNRVSADRISGSSLNGDAGEAVAQGGGTRGVCADQISHYHVPARSDENTLIDVARDHVAGNHVRRGSEPYTGTTRPRTGVPLPKAAVPRAFVPILLP